MKESQGDTTNSQYGFNFRTKTELFTGITHRLKIDLDSSLLMFKNQLDFRIESNNSQYFLSFGLGNRQGLDTSNNEELGNNLSSYSQVSLGWDYNYNDKIFLTLEPGMTINSKYPFNFSLLLMKKLANTNLDLGFYLDQTNTDSSLLSTKNNDRNFFSSGLLISY